MNPPPFRRWLFRERNRRYWDALVPIHRASRFYDVAGFQRGASSLHDIELRAVGDVTGKTLLHPQCHLGLDTLSWARLGAEVVGVDLSAAAISEARRLAEQAGLATRSRFLEGDVLDLTSVIDEKFDVVFTSYGTVTWLPDLHAWARGVAASLKPDGFFYMVDNHPTGMLFEADDQGCFTRPYSYFHREEPLLLPAQPDYADPAHIAEPAVAWIWSLSDIFSALEQQGLSIREVKEYSKTVYRQFPHMLQNSDGYWALPEGESDLPLLFALKAGLRR